MKPLAFALAVLSMHYGVSALAQEPSESLETYKNRPEIAKEIWSFARLPAADIQAKQARLPRKYAVVTRIVRNASSDKPDITINRSERSIAPLGDGFAVIRDTADDKENGYKNDVATLTLFGFLRVYSRRHTKVTNPGGVLTDQIAMHSVTRVASWTLDPSKIAAGYKWSFDYTDRVELSTKLIRDVKESKPLNSRLSVDHKGECVAEARVQASTFNSEFSGTAIPITCTGSGLDGKTTTTKYFYLEDYAYAYEANFFVGQVELPRDVRREYRAAIVK